MNPSNAQQHLVALTPEEVSIVLEGLFELAIQAESHDRPKFHAQISALAQRLNANCQ